MTEKKRAKKVKRQGPISLHPITLRDAIHGLGKAKPKKAKKKVKMKQMMKLKLMKLNQSILKT